MAGNTIASYAVADYDDDNINTVAPGQQGINVMNLIITNPNAPAGPNYKITGVTLTVSGANNDWISAVYVKNAAGNIISQTAWGAANSLYIPIDPLSNTNSAGIAGGTSATYTIGIDIESGAPDTGFSLAIQNAFDLNVERLDGTLLYINTNTHQFPFVSDMINVTTMDTKSSFYNFPNPFRAGSQETTIQYYLAGNAKVSFSIYDPISRKVKTILSGEQQQGGQIYKYSWDGRNDIHKVVLNGVYYGVLKVADKEYFTKIVVIK